MYEHVYNLESFFRPSFNIEQPMTDWDRNSLVSRFHVPKNPLMNKDP